MGGSFCCGHGGEDGGHVLGLYVGAGRLGGPGRDLPARWPDLAGSGGGGRRGAVAFSFQAWLRRGPAMCEVVWVCVRGGEQFAWAAFGGRGGGGPGSSEVCAGGVCGSLAAVGVPSVSGFRFQVDPPEAPAQLEGDPENEGVPTAIGRLTRSR